MYKELSGRKWTMTTPLFFPGCRYGEGATTYVAGTGHKPRSQMPAFPIPEPNS